MNKYLAGEAVTVNFPIAESLGTMPATASYRLLDENETVLLEQDVPTDPANGGVIITIDGTHNVLPIDVIRFAYENHNVQAVRAARIVQITVAMSSGTYRATQTYLIEAGSLLAPGTNSFQTLTKANMVALDIPALNGWIAATDDQKIAAMVQARLNLGMLRYRYRFDDNWMNYVMPEFALYSITTLSQDEYLELPAQFRRDLERAQVIEADDLLNADPVLEKRRAGIVSETVGDSTTSFNPVRPNRGLVCPRAMQEMSRYVLRRTRLSRA
jgi:hypothetical protein